MENMSEQRDNDVTETVCNCGEMHKGHICWLTNMGLFMEVQHLTDNPAVSCSKCGAKANLPHNVCFPAPLTMDQERK
jgi:hypothetical protein